MELESFYVHVGKWWTTMWLVIPRITLAHETSQFQMESTILVMEDTHYAKRFLLHARMYVITFLSEAMQMSGMDFSSFLIAFFLNPA